MTLLHEMEKLSIWEIAHRMHDLDPDEQEKPPAGVRDTIRELLIGAKDFFDPCDSNGNFVGYGPASVVLGRSSRFERKVERVINGRNYDKRWLNSVFIEQDEFEIWCAFRGYAPLRPQVVAPENPA